MVNLVLKGQMEVVSLDVTVTGLGLRPNTIFFVTPDCSGALYLPDVRDTSLVKAAHLDPTKADAIIFPDWTKPAVKVSSRSEGFGCIKTKRLGVLAKSASLSQQGFAPPFSVKRQ